MHPLCFPLHCSAEEEEGLEEEAKAHGLESLHASGPPLLCCSYPFMKPRGRHGSSPLVLVPERSSWGLHLLSLSCNSITSQLQSSQSQPTHHPSRTITKVGAPQHHSWATRAAADWVGDALSMTCTGMHRPKPLGIQGLSAPCL